MNNFEEILKEMVEENLYYKKIGNLEIWREKEYELHEPNFLIRLVDSDE